MKEEFALAWTTSKNSPDKCWVMVLHSERGWELPGGAIGKGEEIEQAAVQVEDEPGPLSWGSVDSNIDEVGWCIDVPDNLGWGAEEIQSIISHDWSNSRSLGS